MHGRRGVLIAIGVLALLTGSSTGAFALVDDFETDFWLPYTDFLLGDKASAGYASTFARSGTRSFHVDISGYSILDFGSAYGYAVFPIQGAAMTELRVSILYDHLEDTTASNWDAYAAGVALDLLDKDFRNLDRVRYVTAYQASRKLSLCGPTKSDVVLAPPSGLGVWTDLARNPAADFPAAHWQSAKFVRVAIGFLCTAGLQGASYSLYFDDFMFDTDGRDADADGLSDLDEESRVYSMSVTSGSTPVPIPSSGTATIEIHAPPVDGIVQWAGVGLEIEHPRPDGLSVELAIPGKPGTQLLWDPGFHARGAAILEPTTGAALRGTVEVRGRAWHADPFVDLYVDGVWIADMRGLEDGSFLIPWSSDSWPEGGHRLRVIAQAMEGGDFVSRTSEEIGVTVDRTPPLLELTRPAQGAVVRGLAAIEAGAHDDRGLAEVALQVDGIPADVRREPPFTFFYETTNLVPGAHTFRVRALDRAGNEAVRQVDVRVGPTLEGVPLPCAPVCSRAAATSGNLPPPAAPRAPLALPLPSGDRLEIVEGFRAPWVAQVVRTDRGVSLILDAMRDPSSPVLDGLVGSTFAAANFTNVPQWQVVVRDFGTGQEGDVRVARILLAARTSPANPDTDADGLKDGAERSSTGTVPVLRDVDADLLTDGTEITSRDIPFIVDGVASVRTIRTDPLDFDTDGDGLPDGAELLPGDPQNPSDPTVPDMDRDGLSDGAERTVFGSDPTRTDTDDDTLSDLTEVTPRSLELEIDGILEVRSVTTSPASPDTDFDGLRDDLEWDGLSQYGFPTDPSDPDTDHDGLSDADELAGLNRRPTNPLEPDTDGDGLIDGLDLSPTELWDLQWQGTFHPGMIRFTQRFDARGVQGLSAQIWTYDIVDNTCVFLSDHTSTATRSSDESAANVVATLNRVLAEGGEHDFVATTARHILQDSQGFASSAYGACDLGHPRQYRFEYLYDSNSFDIEFVNTQESVLHDDSGDVFYQATLEVPIRIAKPQSIVLQLSIGPQWDRGGENVVPAFVYSLTRGTDFAVTTPFYRNLAVGAPLDDHVYEFQFRIPAEVATDDNVDLRSGVPLATLFLMPVWLTSGFSEIARSALDVSSITIGSIVSRVSESAEVVVTRLGTDVDYLGASLPSSAEGLATGYHVFGAYSVYLYRIGDPFDSNAPKIVDAVYILGQSSEEVATFQQTIEWVPEAEWSRRSEDGFGVFLRVFKMIRSGISVTSQIVGRLLVPLVSVPGGASEQMTFGRTTFVVAKLTDIESGRPLYVVGEIGAETIKIRVPHPENPSVMLTEVRTIERELRSEIVDDLDDSRLLAGVRYSQLRSALRGAAVGATLAIFGGQAVVAFRSGNTIKGVFYAAAGAIAVFGIVKADVSLFEDVFATTRILRGKSIKLGTAAAIGVAATLAAYELLLADQSRNSISKLSHYESAGGVVVDALVGVVPLYGTAAMLGWQLGLVVVVGLQAITGDLPNSLALKIVSSPGSTVVFLFEYAFATDIPSDIANDALVQLLSFLAETARYLNSLNPPQPTLLLVP